MLNGQTLKSATSDYDQRHVIAFRPISVAARSWSYDNKICPEVICYCHNCNAALAFYENVVDHDGVCAACREHEFRCHDSGFCYRAAFVFCDGHNHCKDGSDEPVNCSE